jgi:hypothetical protein
LIPFRPDTQSEILRAARILHVRIESVTTGVFQPVSARFQQREVMISLVLIGVLKGDVPEQQNDTIQIRAFQFENLGPRFTAVPGIYSRLDLEPGRELVMFAGPDGVSAAEVLVDPICFLVAQGDRAALDVGFVEEAGSPELSVPALLDRLQPNLARFGTLFARYLVERLTEVLSTETDLAALLRVLEAPDLAADTRSVLCDDAVAMILLESPIPSESVRLFVQSLFRLLLLPEAADLYQDLTNTWIPNLVGIEGAMDQLSSQDVFRGDPLQVQVVGAIEHMTSEPESGNLLVWLKS